MNDLLILPTMSIGREPLNLNTFSTTNSSIVMVSPPQKAAQSISSS